LKRGSGGAFKRGRLRLREVMMESLVWVSYLLIQQRHYTMEWEKNGGSGVGSISLGGKRGRKGEYARP